MKSIFISLLLMLPSCHHESRKAAEENTTYANGISGGKISLLKNIAENAPASEVIDICGWPIWIRELPSRAVFEEEAAFEKIDFSGGKYRFFYSQQNNPTLDYISVSVLFEDGKVVSIDNEWYHE